MTEEEIVMQTKLGEWFKRRRSKVFPTCFVVSVQDVWMWYTAR